MSLITSPIMPQDAPPIPKAAFPEHLGRLHPWIPKNDPLRQHFRPLTITYELPDELKMLEVVIADLQRGDIPYILVGTAKEVEVWRTTKGYRSGSVNPYEE